MPIDLGNHDTNILFSRKNAFYAANVDKWQRGLAAYGGGSAYVKQALIQHTNEIPPEYAERLKRACYMNYPRRVATVITQYVLAKRPERDGATPEIVEDFSRTGMRVDEVMRQFSTYLNICGCAWLCVDAPAFDGVKTRKDELEERLRPYCVAMNPLCVPDWHYGGDGRLDWVLTAELKIDNSNPFSNPVEFDIRKLWMKDRVIIVSLNKTSGEKTVSQVPNPIGEVPFIRHVEVDGYGIGENHWFEDVVRISDAILNAESEAQMNCLKQMFGLLVIPEDFLDTVKQLKKAEDDGEGGNAQGKPGEPLSYTLARSAALFESKDGANVSRYIQPAGTETQTIRNEIEALRRELFSVVGLATTKETRMVESAESKAWDFQSVEAFMETRADILEQCEVKAWELLNEWDSNIAVPTVSYNRNFALLDLQNSVATLLQLSGFCQENDQFQREVEKTAVEMLNRLRQLPAEAVEAINKAIDSSTPGKDNKEKNEMIKQMKDEMNNNADDGAGAGDDGGENPDAGGNPPKNQIGFNR